MKVLCFIQKNKILLLFVCMIVFGNQNVLSQKNTLRITPVKLLIGKTNISYERALNDRWAVLVDVQRWFVSDKERSRQSIYGVKGEPVFENNKGTRYSLALRNYFSLKKAEKWELKYFYGLGGFIGNHSISMKRKSYSYQSNWNNGSWSGLTVLPDLQGKVDLISGGTYLDLGIQIKLSNFLKLEIGAFTGYAFIDKKNDFLTLIDYSPYVLEEDRVTYDQKYKSGIEGFYIEPMFNIGFSF